MIPPPFVILCMPRTGSYHLASLLHSAHDVICHGEVYKLHRVELNGWHRRRMGVSQDDVAARDAEGMEFLDRLRALHPKKITGFKAFPRHLRDLPVRAPLLFGGGWRRIALRRNPLEAHLSALRAKATEVYTYQRGEPPPAPEALTRRVRFDLRKFESYMKRVRAFDDLVAAMREAGPRLVLETDYARLNDPAERRRILGFIGSRAAAEDLASDRMKQFRGNILDGVENADEMAEALERAGHGALLRAALRG